MIGVRSRFEIVNDSCARELQIPALLFAVQLLRALVLTV